MFLKAGFFCPVVVSRLCVHLSIPEHTLLGGVSGLSNLDGNSYCSLTLAGYQAPWEVHQSHTNYPHTESVCAIFSFVNGNIEAESFCLALSTQDGSSVNSVRNKVSDFGPFSCLLRHYCVNVHLENCNCSILVVSNVEKQNSRTVHSKYCSLDAWKAIFPPRKNGCKQCPYIGSSHTSHVASQRDLECTGK